METSAQSNLQARSAIVKWSLAALFFSTGYAIIRYHIFGTVGWDQLPLYVLNKGVSFGGLILLAASRCHGEPLVRRQLGVTGFALVVLHLVLSLPILQPAYFGKLFSATGWLNGRGELAMLFGILGFAALGGLYIKSRAAGSKTQGAGRALIPYLGRAALLATALHVGVIGFDGWLNPSTWPGGLPPITLISMVIAGGAILWRRDRVSQVFHIGRYRPQFAARAGKPSRLAA